MLPIALSLFTGWFLGLFGFKGVVIAGMAQIFGISINVLGYYFLFAIIGVLNWIMLNLKMNKKINLLNKDNEDDESVKHWSKSWSNNGKK